MLHKIYSKNKEDKHLIIPDLEEFKDYLNCILPGSKIKWRNEKRRYTCIDRSDNFIIVAKPYNFKKDVCQYSILDLTQMKCNVDNSVFGLFNYMNKDDCKQALEMLERSLLPFEDLYEYNCTDEDGRKTYKPKDPDNYQTLEISQRGWADIEDVIDEIWVEATYVG